jgi:hypothetical protein
MLYNCDDILFVLIESMPLILFKVLMAFFCPSMTFMKCILLNVYLLKISAGIVVFWTHMYIMIIKWLFINE